VDVGDRGRDDGSRFDDVGTSEIGEWSLWLIAMLMICYLIFSFSTLFSLFRVFLFVSVLFLEEWDVTLGCVAEKYSLQQTNLLTPINKGG
jgi:hypothetical protein